MPALMAAATATVPPPAHAAALGADLMTTPAERCAYRCTPRYRETLDYAGRLAKASPLLRLSFFGESAEGYPLPLVTASRDPRFFEPAAARASGLPIVLIFSGIHAGEIDGKDASLALLRDIAAGGRASLLEKMVLLVVPIYNVDGHERVGPHNRLAQDGPVEGMGFRTNGRGLDLNRDFVKLESPETVALVGRLFREWRPHLVVDCHVTDGMDFQYEMTYYAGEGPNAPEPLRRYVEGIKKAIGKGLAETGHKAAPWGDLDDPADPNKGVSLWSASPRYSTSYFETRNRVSLLAESHAHKPFPVRVAATFEMLRAILEHVAADPEALLRTVRESEEETARRASALSEARFVLRADVSREASMVDYEGWDFTVVTSEVTGQPRVVWSRTPATWRVPLRSKFVPTLEVAVPRGYLLSRAYAPLAEKALLHGLRVERTREDATLDVEVARVSQMTWEDHSYQGHHAAAATVRSGVERRFLPAGTFWIPLDQPDASIAVWMFEPESPDGLLSWNYFDNVLERKMIVEDHVVEAIAAEALKDPAVRAEYERAVASDPTMKDDPRRRLMWFYERSPFFDREVGVYPVFRVTGSFDVPTVPWSLAGSR